MVIKQDVACGIVQGLAGFWKCEELQDFTVALGDIHFGCHRLLLAACSDFFRGLFRSGMKETEQKIVYIKKISSETFELIMESMYTGHGIVTNDNIIDIWRAAHQLQIHFLMSECEHFVKDTLSTENYAKYFYISNSLNSTVTLEALWPFVLKNCNSFFQTSYFLKLPMDDVLSLIKCQDLETKSEDDVIYAILKWAEFQEDQNNFKISEVDEDDIENSDNRDKCRENEVEGGEGSFQKSTHCNESDLKKNSTLSCAIGKKVQTDSCHNQEVVNNKDKRDKFVVTLLSNTRTCLVSQECLEMLVSHPLTKDNKDVKDIVIDASFYQSQASKRNGQWPSRAVRRHNSDFEHCIVDVRKIGNNVLFNAYSLARKKWFPMSKGSSNVGWIRHAAVGEKLYALCTNSSFSELFFFQFEKNTWLNENLTVKFSSKDFCVAVVDCFLYIFTPLEKKVWKLDPTLKKATDFSDAPELKDLSHVVSFDKLVLVFCNLTSEGGDETVVQCYDTSTNTWTKLNNLEGSANGITSFKDDNFTYILQSHGDMWKVVKHQSNIIDIELVVKLWSSDWPLYGAVTFMEELYIHGSKSGDFSQDPNLKRSLPGVFTKINYMESKFTEHSISIPFILNRKYLV